MVRAQPQKGGARIDRPEVFPHRLVSNADLVQSIRNDGRIEPLFGEGAQVLIHLCLPEGWRAGDVFAHG